MADSAFLDDDCRDRIMLILEAAAFARNSAGFFLWTQGALQTLLPHEILICCMRAGPGRPGFQRWFSSSRYYKQEHFEATTDLKTGIVEPLLREWKGDPRPRLLLVGRMSAEEEGQLERLELRNLIAHGVRGWEPDSGGFFLFGRTTLDDSPRTRFLVELLVPQIHVTFSRVLAEESWGEDAAPLQETPVTPREVEILHWIKEGKRTGDIAQHLGLSPFTVRNHVKNILRKLDSRSRSQAVARAISLGILLHSPQH